uniref:Fatty acid hydroxylase domain-containing protein n=1 Tax=Lotharella oceanica TaxID=641309 RepID=A0A7S2X6M2_9EUKA
MAEMMAYNEFREFNRFLNGLIGLNGLANWAEAEYGPEYGYYLTLYVRNLVSATIIYYTMGVVWSWMVDRSEMVFGMQVFKGGEVKRPGSIQDQIILAQMSLFLYAGLPVFDEFLIEYGYTRVYMSMSEVGGFIPYLFYTIVYFFLVEIGIYWMHRKLHTNPFLFKYIHSLHHKYNTPDYLSPWASIAFNPLDGIMQACPYTIVMMFWPCHYITHFVMLFLTAIWATNIHDTLVGDTEPLMGSKYHTVHHTHYNCNYGQYLVLCDYMWGTLRQPAKEKTQKTQ